MSRDLSQEEQQALAEMRSAFKHEEFLPWLRQQVWQWCVQQYRRSDPSDEGRNAQHPNVQKELQRHKQERSNQKCLEGLVPISGGEDLSLLDCCALSASFWDIYGVVPQVIRENDLEDIPTPAVAFWATKMVVEDATEADLRGIGGAAQWVCTAWSSKQAAQDSEDSLREATSIQTVDVEPLDDAVDAAETNLTKQQLLLFRRLKQTRHFVSFDSLADVEGAWQKRSFDSGTISDSTIKQGLKRLKVGLPEPAFDLTIDVKTRRARLVRLLDESPTKAGQTLDK
ncbi:MAG: hypothetical protein WD049_00225 [Candidatus Paceibacterota bacterium]